MNLRHCCNVLYLIHFHWELTRFSFYPVVLSLIGWSRTDWNLINLTEWIWLLWNTNTVLWVHCRETKIHWSRSGLLPMCSEDNFLQPLRDKNCFWHWGIFVSSSWGFFKVQPAWVDSVMENGSFFVQVLFFYVYKWAGSSRLAPSALLLLPSRQRKVLFHEQFFFAPLLFYHKFNLWWNTATASLKHLAYETVSCVNISFTFLFCTIVPFLPKSLKQKLKVAHVEPVGCFSSQLCIRPISAMLASNLLAFRNA